MAGERRQLIRADLVRSARRRVRGAVIHACGNTASKQDFCSEQQAVHKGNYESCEPGEFSPDNLPCKTLRPKTISTQHESEHNNNILALFLHGVTDKFGGLTISTHNFKF